MGLGSPFTTGASPKPESEWPLAIHAPGARATGAGNLQLVVKVKATWSEWGPQPHSLSGRASRGYPGIPFLPFHFSKLLRMRMTRPFR